MWRRTVKDGNSQFTNNDHIQTLRVETTMINFDIKTSFFSFSDYLF